MNFLAIVLTIIFAISRIMGLITWSWWAVLSPVLVYCGVWMLIIIISIIAALIMKWLD